ncbi:structural maintenance of chromosomes protein 6 isoform X2 [Toxorhynchites rutilus septentrionalis]|uniref:structural maintenance of chromosomes protein 6 isoform X2 n=1 Tax=Toxorhynchites rutilus septentrionalis TaxID=329112 RepID=UPI0024797AC8|nr:structural maintenance of chromosomes protein 6 isoform X2 [Toxorhynchites rutilus septentrionalis]
MFYRVCSNNVFKLEFFSIVCRREPNMNRRKREKSPEVTSNKRCRIQEDSDSENEASSQLPVSSQLSLPSNIEHAIIHDITHNIRSGKVLRIQLKNFMCHRNLVVDFNKSANLLVGNNGSGKSAVLAALTIGLGCSANMTNRSSSVKQLIKHGETQATIEIHLENDSFDAFERNVYGNKIIVVRTINASGATNYKLKSESGNVVSTSRSELLKLILYLNIQVDNPVCVLNQDLARSFLKDSDEKKQYTLFLKATQMDAIMAKLNDCTPKLENAKHNLDCNEKNLRHKMREIEELQEKYRNLQSVEELKELVKNARIKLGWRKVMNMEAECTQVEDQLREKLGTMKEYMNAIQNREAIEIEIERTVQRYRNDIDAKKTTFGEIKDKYVQARRVAQQLLEQLADKKRQIVKIKDRMTRQEEDIKSLEVDLKQRSESGFNRVVEEKKRNEQMIVELSDKKQDILVIIENSKRDVDNLHNTLNQISDAKEENNHKRVAKQHERSRTEAQLRQFESSSRDNLSVFGQNMPAFVAKIKELHKQGRFTELPRGPLGQYIKVKDKKWTAMIETVISPGMLTAFYVNSDADRNTMNQLIQREFPEMRGRTIITSRFHKQVYDVCEGSVGEIRNAHSLMNLISVSDPVVMNCLIDQVRIETILAVEEQNLAIHLTSQSENVPRNLQKVVVMEPFSEFFPMPNYRSYGLQKRNARYLQVNLSELKKQTEARMVHLDEELKVLNQHIEQETRKQNEKQRALNDRQRQLAKQQQELNSLEVRINELKAIEYPAESEDVTLQNELEELKASQIKLAEEVTRGTENMESFMREISAQDRNVQEKKEHMSQIERELQVLQEQIDGEQQKRHDMQTNSKTKQQQLDRLRQEVQSLQANRNELKQGLENSTQEAREVGDRVEVTETHDQLKKTISSTENKIKHINSNNDDINDVKSVLENKIMKMNTAQQSTVSLKKVIKVLQNSRSARYAYLHKLKSHMSLRVKHKFNSVMHLRGFVGEIVMDTKKSTLSLSVVPRDKNVTNAVSSTKSLSGGERSYSTVALLIALWSCVDTPFYFLDEYDVFTDQVNRHMMTMLLLNETKKRPDRQFCFLTPQDMSNIQANNELTIHRMADPDRC